MQGGRGLALEGVLISQISQFQRTYIPISGKRYPNIPFQETNIKIFMKVISQYTKFYIGIPTWVQYFLQHNHERSDSPYSGTLLWQPFCFIFFSILALANFFSWDGPLTIFFHLCPRPPPPTMTNGLPLTNWEGGDNEPILFSQSVRKWNRPKGSGLLMTRLYKENAKSWAAYVSVLTLLVLNSSKTAMAGPIFMI